MAPRLNSFLLPRRLRERKRAVRFCAVRRAALASRALRPRCRSQNQRFHRAVKKAAVAKAANPGAAKRAAPPLAPPAAAKMDVQQLGQYQEDLRLYRELRGELQARARAAAGRLELGSRSYAPARVLQMWSDAFAEEKGRRPDRKDVSDTGIKWLVRCEHHPARHARARADAALPPPQIDRYTAYTALKKKLLARTPTLRTSLAQKLRAEMPRPLAPGELPLPADFWTKDEW